MLPIMLINIDHGPDQPLTEVEVHWQTIGDNGDEEMTQFTIMLFNINTTIFIKVKLKKVIEDL